MTVYKTFEGTWHCAYWYPSNTHKGEDVSEYEVTAYQKGDSLVLESRPNEIGAYMFVKLTIDSNTAVGTWHETTSPEGEFKGMIYTGGMALLIDADGQGMHGTWVGLGRNHRKKAADINTGRWELTRQL